MPRHSFVKLLTRQRETLQIPEISVSARLPHAESSAPSLQPPDPCSRHQALHSSPVRVHPRNTSPVANARSASIKSPVQHQPCCYALVQVLHIGPVRLAITGETDPCERMDMQHQGLRKTLTPAWRGVTCFVVGEGTIQVEVPADQIARLLHF